MGIVEKQGSVSTSPIRTGAIWTTVSDRRYVWSGTTIAEERDASSGNVTKRYFAEGEQRLGGSDAGLYYFTRDHLGSIRELTDSSGAIRAQYEYDPYGTRFRIGGNVDTDFGFTGYWHHSASGLDLAPYRAYSSSLGRWFSRDPIGEKGGLNLYQYVANDPLTKIDRFGDDFGTWDAAGRAGASSDFSAIAGLTNVEASGLICKKKNCESYVPTGPVLGSLQKVEPDTTRGLKEGIALGSKPFRARCPKGYDPVGFHYAHPIPGDTINRHQEDYSILRDPRLFDQSIVKGAVSATPHQEGVDLDSGTHYESYPKYGSLTGE